MTTRPNLIWPLVLTVWLLYAGVDAARDGMWSVVVCAAATAVLAWGLYVYASKPQR